VLILSDALNKKGERLWPFPYHFSGSQPCISMADDLIFYF